MAKIKPATFPGKIGTANEIKIKTSFDLEENDAKIMYQLIDTITKKTIHFGSLVLPVEIYFNWGVDNQPIIEWVISQLGLELEII